MRDVYEMECSLFSEGCLLIGMFIDWECSVRDVY